MVKQQMFVTRQLRKVSGLMMSMTKSIPSLTGDANDMEFSDFSEDTQSGYQGMICRYFVVHEVSPYSMLIPHPIAQMLKTD